MPCALCQTLKDLKGQFDEAKKAVDPATVERVMKGLPVADEWSIPGIRDLRIAWAQYHQRMRYA